MLKIIPFLFLLLLIAACPPDDIGDGSTSVFETGDSSGEPTGTQSSLGLGFDCRTIEQVVATRAGIATSCAKHPWSDPCEDSFVTCESMVLDISETPGCADIDWCDYIACADAMASASCGDAPVECIALQDCLG
jgi:hypothetical protein